LQLDPAEEFYVSGYAVGRAGAVPEPSLEEVTAVMAALPSLPPRATFATPRLVVPAGKVTELPWFEPGQRAAGLAALQASERTLGLRVGVEMPEGLASVPREAWPALRAVRRLTQAGLPVSWHVNGNAPDEPKLHGFGVRIGERGEGAGIDASSANAAFTKAVAEAVERFVWDQGPAASRIVRAAPDSLNGTALHLETIAGYAPALRRSLPARLAWDAATPFAWIEATSLLRDTPRLVPVQLVSGNSDVAAGEPELRPRVTTGLAAQTDRKAALLAGLLEVIERDAFMVTWLGRLPVSRLDLTTFDDPRVHDVCERFGAARLVPSAVLLATDVPVPVVLGVIQDPSGVGPAIALGATAAASAADAVVHALTEAFAVWRMARRRREHGEVPQADPSRLDRVGRVLWWAEGGERLEALRWLLEAAPLAPAPSHSHAAESPGTTLERLLAWFATSGDDVLAVDLTDEPLVRRTGLHVTAVVVPTFHPMHLREQRPARWSARLERVPRALGLPVAPELNVLPHPFP
jgi:ribosomal protein S12 methylthiotransferase accessory factor